MRIRTGLAIRGNTLLVVVIFTAILGVLLLSYLNMLNNSNVLTVRSLSWNNALPVAEAGIEEAMAAIQAAGTNAVASVLTNNGWIASGNQLTKSRALSNSYYGVLITSANPAFAIGASNPPVICSTGYVLVPMNSTYIGRTVMVTTKTGTKGWDYGMLAKNNINVSGNGSTFDSYDSSDPTLSTGGMYDPLKRDDHAHIGVNNWANGCATIGSGKVYGDVTTQFGAKVIALTGGGIVGDEAYVDNSANKSSVESGHLLYNFSPSFPDVQVPYTSGSTLGPGVVNGTSYQYVAGSDNYYFSGDMTLSSGVLIQGNAKIYVTGSFNINGGGYMLLAPGASLTMVVGGPSCSINGGGILNTNGVAANCTFQCLPTCTSGAFGGGGAFVGTINAPEADFTLSGGAGVYGAFIANSFKLSGGMCVHYDESLGSSKPGTVYGVASWKEL
jgi:hypothetical protein